MPGDGTSGRSDQSSLLEPADDVRRRLGGCLTVGVEPELRALGLLVRRRHAGEVVELATECALVQALVVAAGALLHGGGHVDLDEDAVTLDQLAGALAG